MATSPKPEPLKWTGPKQTLRLPGGVFKSTDKLNQKDLKGLQARENPNVK